SPRISSTGRASSAGASRQSTEALPRSSCTISPIRRRSAAGGACSSFFLNVKFTDYVLPVSAASPFTDGQTNRAGLHISARCVTEFSWPRSLRAVIHIARAQQPHGGLHVVDGAIECPQAGLLQRHPVHLDDLGVLVRLGGGAERAGHIKVDALAEDPRR